MARTITADTFNRWWEALDEWASAEGDTSRSDRNPAGVRLNAKAALGSLEMYASPTHLFHDGLYSDGQPIRRRIAGSDGVVLQRSDGDGNGYGDEYIEDLIRNIVALTGIKPEYIDASGQDDDGVQPMVERLREAREARDE